MENDIQLRNILIKVNDIGTSRVMVVGDFNFPEINWETETTTKSANHCSQRFLNVTQPTRCRHGKNPHTLDLILTSDEDMVSNLAYGAGIDLSDHVIISYTLNIIPTPLIKANHVTTTIRAITSK